jgi:hypothetical protein
VRRSDSAGECPAKCPACPELWGFAGHCWALWEGHDWRIACCTIQQKRWDILSILGGPTHHYRFFLVALASCLCNINPHSRART